MSLRNPSSPRLRRFPVKKLVITALTLWWATPSFSQELYPLKLTSQVWHNEQRELRYHPEGSDFVITNGNRLFTRALYGTNTAFRVEAGDRPEFALYMPGMGGNFKFGIEAGGKSKWLTTAATITARYRPGAMLYTITDPILGTAKLNIEILAIADAEGLVIKAEFEGLQSPVNLLWAFGGASGKKFSRDGDMGPDPESSFYLKAENCKDNSFELPGNGQFRLTYGAGLQVGQDGRYFTEDLNQASVISKGEHLTGTFPPSAMLKLGDATQLGSPTLLYASMADKAPVITGKLSASSGTYYFSVHNPAAKPAIAYTAVPNVFQQAEQARLKLANRIQVKTPDPYLNTIGGALAMAADGIWEAPTYLHGSIGWRMRLDGWRGPYTGDELGWHDRALSHFEAYAKSQVTSPASGPVLADTAQHLSRSTEKLGFGMFTSGYISRDPDGKNLRAHHYDMNLPYIDELLWHFRWTGDKTFMKATWPLIKRHLEWETRNFDPDGDGLYDAYAAIWASDALEYSGGGVAHSSAYNYIAFKTAAQLAVIMGEDPAPYRKEAAKILHAMNTLLWMPGKGAYAEYRDALGNRLLHPSPAIWTVYHSMDSQVPDRFQAWQSMRYIDNEIPHIPVRATGLPDNGYYTLSTTSWMPYTWSLNNVAMAESMHTALANWQAGRADEAFKLFKSEILVSMYLGGSPGNIVQISHFDAVRGEAYRDFGDPIGMVSRALVEGLFGIVPDALTNTVTLRPGLPASWNYASFITPDISFDFKRTGQKDTYTLVPKFPVPLNLKFQAFARGQVKTVLVNGKAVSWKNLPASVGKPVIELAVPAAKQYTISITWQGALPALPATEKVVANGSRIAETLPGTTVMGVFDPQQSLTDFKPAGPSFTATATHSTGDHTAFIHLSQGKLSWWMPVCFKTGPAVSLLLQNNGEANNQSFSLQNNSAADLQATVEVNTFTSHAVIPAGKNSEVITVAKEALLTGTNNVTIRLSNGNTEKEQLVNWNAATNNKLETIDLTHYFNDQVTQIFKNKYLTPRPQVTTLQLPWQGTGDWPHPLEMHDINDSGLRKLAGDKNQFTTPQGLIFATPGAQGKNNIVFTSQWDNYPREKAIPLSGKASHAWFLMAGSTNPMQSQLDNGSVAVTYTDGTTDTLALRNPETWWPIEKDYYTDGFAFALKLPRPTRVHLQTGQIVSGEDSKARYNGREISGGAATILDLPLDATKTLKSVKVRAIANDVVIGLMAVTLARE